MHIFAFSSGSSFYAVINEIKMIKQMLGPVFLESMVSFLNIVGPCVGNMGKLLQFYKHLFPSFTRRCFFYVLVSGSEDEIALVNSIMLQMLDDFVDVTKDEKLMMHMWNSFVRKQR